MTHKKKYFKIFKKITQVNKQKSQLHLGKKLCLRSGRFASKNKTKEKNFISQIIQNEHILFL